MIPYGRQAIGEDDIQAVVDVLRSDWLTTGPSVEIFESSVADMVGSRYAVAVSSGTAALHSAMYAIGIGNGDEVIVPAMTFAATANVVVMQGGRPVFVDVNPDNLLVDLGDLETKITTRTKAIVAVDFAGHPCDYDGLWDIANRRDIPLIADACHSLGGSYCDRNVGSLASLNAFSFHPVKHITTGEGGMVTTDDSGLASRMRMFRNHGIAQDFREREKKSSWFYEMIDLGYNYRITDFQCALGLSQLKKLSGWISRRREIAAMYDEAFKAVAYVNPLKVAAGVNHAYHLYVVRLNGDASAIDRNDVFLNLRNSGVGVNVHYIPVHIHPFYQSEYGTAEGDCPNAEAAYKSIISLPMYPSMTDAEVQHVIRAVLDATKS